MPGIRGKLKSKYGDGHARAKGPSKHALCKWERHEDKVSKQACGIYEDFRPPKKGLRGRRARFGKGPFRRGEDVMENISMIRRTHPDYREPFTIWPPL